MFEDVLYTSGMNNSTVIMSLRVSGSAAERVSCAPLAGGCRFRCRRGPPLRRVALTFYTSLACPLSRARFARHLSPLLCVLLCA